MSTRKEIEALFSGYEKTVELTDFMEELESNLNDRIALLEEKGLSEQEARSKAMEELGDVSALADELSLKKRQEVWWGMYMKKEKFLSKVRCAWYVVCGLEVGLAVLILLISWFSSGEATAAVGAVLPLGMGGILGLVLLGLTQETAARYAMGWKRALWYVLASALVLFSIMMAFIISFDMAWSVRGIVVLMVLALPGIALGVFLILTEKDRRKPWMVKWQNELESKLGEEIMERTMSRMGRARSERFGILSGALWIAAIAGFVLIIMTLGIKFSWLAIVAAIILQLLLLAGFTTQDKE